jgi:adenine/guanine phosphoribosyltransferase-like PRPP-binding protein
LLNESLTVRGDEHGTCILLLDDVLSSGATTSAYPDRSAEAGGRVSGVLAVTKFPQEQPLLNPDIYPPLMR